MADFNECRAILRNDLSLARRALKMLTEIEQVLDKTSVIESRSATDCLRPHELDNIRRQLNSTTRLVNPLVKTASSSSKETALVIQLDRDEKDDKGEKKGDNSAEAAECLVQGIAMFCKIATAEKSHELVDHNPTAGINLAELQEEQEALDQLVDSSEEKICALQHLIKRLKSSALDSAGNI